MRRFKQGWLKTSVVNHLKIAALKGIYTGTYTPQNNVYLDDCKAIYTDIDFEHQLVFSRDFGMHDCGWWKNPDYNQCLHLSLSFQDFHGNPLDHNHKKADEWLELLFGESKNLLWIEPPFSEHGKDLDIYHYRVFTDRNWQPIMPRKEVYSKDFTPAGWLSYSDRNDLILKNLDREAVLD